MLYSEKTTRTAIVVSENGEVEKLNRVPFMTASYNEVWLQELIADNPSVIPSAEVGGEYSPLICIGREVPVGSGDTQGYIDNLYVSPSGAVVIVETKLFRNQEARRTVVAQVIDYAKELQKWDCERLDAVCADYQYKTNGQAARIIDVMASKGYLSLSDEARFTDNVNECLKNASFLMMIIGDGIRSGVQQLADFINEHSNMSFNLSLAELEIYQRGTETVVIPNLITKTYIIEKRVHGYDPFSPIGENRSQPEAKHYVRKPVLSRREFVSEFSDNGGYDADMITEFLADLEAISGITVEIAPTELTVRFCPGGDSTYALFTFGLSGGRSDLWIMPGRIKAALQKHGLFDFDADEFLEFFKRFIDTKRCRTAPYEYEAGYYYASINAVLDFSSDVLSAVEQFITTISKHYE